MSSLYHSRYSAHYIYSHRTA